jgi:G:T-mismatch repair DNA endonuclease (very short patch repair protein)
MPSKIYDNNFCSDKCSREFYSKKRTEEKVCEYCGQNFVVKKSHVDIARFCSRECKDRWQSTDANCGENHPCFQGLTRKCAECGKTIPIRKHRLKIQENFFCNKECRIKYYKNPQNRTEKQKEASKAFAKNAIKYIKPTLTSPHKIINEILDKNSIIYRNEELIHYYKLDIYLPDFNLGIEVQGDFWHCSPIRYKNVIYERQRKCIIKDKAKHTYVKNKFGYEILYLWEKDINTNPKLCEKLIQKYIRNNGVLFNYHSFNYFLDRDKLELKNKIIVPYQDKNKIEYINLINT